MIAVTIVATVPVITHTLMAVTRPVRTEVIMTSFIPAATSVVMPAVSTAIGHVEVWTTKVEVVTMRVAGIDAEVPVSSLPVQRAVEIGGCAEQVPLPAIEYVTQVQVATLPVGAEHIAITSHAHQVVQINLIGCLVLCVSQVQFVCHLIGQEQCLSASLLV